MVLAEEAFKIVKELESLLVHYQGERIVRFVCSNLWVQRRVVAVEAEGLHVLDHGYVAEICIHHREVLSVNLSAHFSFFKDSEAFIEPHIAPVFACDLVSGPGVSDLVRGNVDLRFVTGDDCWGCKGEQRVFHAAEWEGRWQHEDAVVAPNVISQILFGSVEKFGQRCKLGGDSFHVTWLGYDPGPASKRTVLKISDCDRDQIRSHLDLIRKSECCVGRVPENCASLVRAHVYFEVVLDDHCRFVGDLDGRRVLHGSDGTAGNILALRENIWQFLATGLRWLQPVDGCRLIVCLVSKSYLDTS